jgi:tetrahydromethanopterin S-methyltransferase subunit D
MSWMMITGITLLIASGLYFFGVGIAGMISDEVRKDLKK